MQPTIIFDLGAVLLHIQVEHFVHFLKEEQRSLRIDMNPNELQRLMLDFEKGLLSSEAFFASLAQQMQHRVTESALKAAWSAILLQPVAGGWQLLPRLKRQYRLLLLSNTNAAHRAQFDTIFDQYLGKGAFYRMFDEVYYSHEIQLVKPDLAIFKKVLQEQRLKPENTWFVDDKRENTAAAAKLGVKTFTYRNEEDWQLLEKRFLGEG